MTEIPGKPLSAKQRRSEKHMILYVLEKIMFVMSLFREIVHSGLQAVKQDNSRLRLLFTSFSVIET